MGDGGGASPTKTQTFNPVGWALPTKTQTFNLVGWALPTRINHTILNSNRPPKQIPRFPIGLAISRFSIENNYQSSTEEIAHFLVANATLHFLSVFHPCQSVASFVFFPPWQPFFGGRCPPYMAGQTKHAHQYFSRVGWVKRSRPINRLCFYHFIV